MAQFTPLVTSAEFTPTSYDDYMKPHLLAEAAYQTRRQALDQSADALSAYLPYLNDATPEARKLYDDAQQQLERNVALLGTKGWNLNPEPLIAFKDQYRKTNSILKKAATSLEEQQKADKEAMAKDGSLFVRYKNKAGEFIQPNIDSMITNDYSRHLVSGNDIQANSMAAAQALSSRVKAAFSSFAKIGQTTGYYSSKNGTMAGVPNAVLMDWLMTPERYQEDINSWLKNVRARGGKHAEDTMRSLFNGEIAKALEDVVGRTDYDNMEQSDQVRLNKYLMTGVYQGLKYDESYQVNDTPFDDREREGGGRQGSNPDGVVTPDVKPPKTEPQLFTSEDVAKRDTWKKISKFFNIDETQFGSSGLLGYTDQLSLVNLNREYGGEDDYAKADEFIRTITNAKDEQGNSKGSGILDYFSLFDKNGNLLKTEAFNNKYLPVFAKLYSKELSNKNKTSSDYGREYTKLIRGNDSVINDLSDSNIDITTPGEIPQETKDEYKGSANRVYRNIKSAILDLYEVADEEKNRILNDTTGKAFDKFVNDNKITEAGFKNKLIDMADRYANVTVDQQYATFTANNESIIRDAIKTSQVTSGKNQGNYNLTVIDGADQYSFKVDTYMDESGKKHRYKTYKIKPGYEKSLSDSELFFYPGDEKNKSFDCVYYIPADPEQGIVVKFPSGVKALIPPEKLGSLYNKNMISTWTNAAKQASATMTACIDRIKEINTETEKIKANKDMSDSEKAEKIAALQEEIQQCGEAYQSAQNSTVYYRSEITKAFVNNISTSYKPNNI